jgi:multiple sugar transport system substrate-binding protein
LTGLSGFTTQYYDTLIEQFSENHPSVTVEQSDDPATADVIVNWGAPLVTAYDQSEILDLSQFLENNETIDQDDYYPGVFDAFTTNGKTWAIPATLDPLIIYYNKDLFDQYGVPYPEPGWTMDDFMNTVQALTDEGAGVFGYGPHYQEAGRFDDAVVFILRQGGRLADDLTNPKQATFDDPATVEAISWYTDLVNNYHVAPTPTEAAPWRSHPLGGFGLGRLAMYMGALQDHVTSVQYIEWTMNWGVVPVPTGEQPYTQVWVTAYAISSQTASPEASWAWIEFLTRQTSHNVQMPARRSLAESDAYAEVVGEEIAETARMAVEQGGTVTPRLWIGDFGTAMGFFQQALLSITRGDSTPQEAMDSAQRQAEAVLGQ